MDASQVEQQVAEIKAHMPRMYAAIQEKASRVGREAFALVRRGLRGEPNCFYAIEAGRVMGTPFTSDTTIMADVAQLMVQFGCSYVCVWPVKEAEHG